MNKKIFIGSSTNAIKKAEALKKMIVEKSNGQIECTLWNEKSQFRLSHATIDSLIEIANDLDHNKGFAVLIFSPDDEITLNKGNTARERTEKVPRDNVVFELGLFLGKLGRDHVICVRPENIKMRILSDWEGMTDVLYKFQKNHLDRCMEEPASRIVDAVL